MTGYQKASVEDVLNQLMEENRKLIKRVETLEEYLVKLSNDNKDLKSEINDLKEQILVQFQILSSFLGLSA